MSATAAPQLPEPWAYAFDWEHNYCSRGADYVVDELADDVLPAPLRTEIAALDDEDARDRLTELADQAEADGQGEREDALRAAAAGLDYCSYSCCCASDAWDCDQDYLTELLAGVPGQVWSVVEPDRWRGEESRVVHDDRYDIDVEDLFTLVSTREGWSQLNVTWDGQKLTVVFDGWHIRRTELVCTPLSDAQCAARDVWLDADPYNEQLATAVVDADPAHLAAAVRLWEGTENPEEVFGEFAHLLEALAVVDGGALEAEVIETARRLADGWTATVAELLTVATDILGPTREFALV